MSVAVALLFPGQGSQYVGMGADLRKAFPESREVMEEAESVLGYGLAALCDEGPEEALSRTEHAQPAILAVSVMVLRALESRTAVQPSAVAGHSLGEYTAMVAAGVLDFADALRLVRARGQLMQAAVPVGVGGMAAIVGLDEAAIELLCGDAGRPGEVLEVANVNGAGQVVVAGHATAVDRAVTIAKERGARLARRLPVSAPFHCALMEPAALGLAELLAGATVRVPKLPVISSIDGLPEADPHAIRERLGRQIVQPVRWDRCVRTLATLGCDEGYEVGPGNVLSGLGRRMQVGPAARPLGTAAAVERLAAGLAS